MIPLHELVFSYVRSSGPGGQNVNKVNSKAVLHWNCVNTNELSFELKNRFIERFSGRITKDGFIVITSDRYRDQTRNREDCIVKLNALIAQVLHPPKARKKTRPKYSSVVKRKESKKKQSEKKKNRSRIRE